MTRSIWRDVVDAIRRRTAPPIEESWPQARAVVVQDLRPREARLLLMQLAKQPGLMKQDAELAAALSAKLGATIQWRHKGMFHDDSWQAGRGNDARR